MEYCLISPICKICDALLGNDLFFKKASVDRALVLVWALVHTQPNSFALLRVKMLQRALRAVRLPNVELTKLSWLLQQSLDDTGFKSTPLVSARRKQALVPKAGRSVQCEGPACGAPWVCSGHRAPHELRAVTGNTCPLWTHICECVKGSGLRSNERQEQHVTGWTQLCVVKELNLQYSRYRATFEPQLHLPEFTFTCLLLTSKDKTVKINDCSGHIEHYTGHYTIY